MIIISQTFHVCLPHYDNDGYYDTITPNIFLYTKHCSKCISWIILLNLHNKTLRSGLVLTPLNIWGKWAQRVYTVILSKILQLVSGRGLESVSRAVFQPWHYVDSLRPLVSSKGHMSVFTHCCIAWFEIPDFSARLFLPFSDIISPSHSIV